jgi:hypothetical protein
VASRPAMKRLLYTLANALVGWILCGLWLAVSCCSPWRLFAPLRLDCCDELHAKWLRAPTTPT